MLDNPNDISNTDQRPLTVDQWEADRKALVESLTAKRSALEMQLKVTEAELARLGVQSETHATPSKNMVEPAKIINAPVLELDAKKPKSLPDRILEKLAFESLTSDELAYELGIDKSFLNSTLSRMKKADRIKATGTKGSYTYSPK